MVWEKQLNGRKNETHLPAVGVKVSHWFFSTPCVAENERVIYLEHLFDITKTWQKVDMGLCAHGKRQHASPLGKNAEIESKKSRNTWPWLFLGPKQQVGIDFLCMSVCVLAC
jgi:hypothetical protein